jgi:ankyrin repeat protein
MDRVRYLLKHGAHVDSRDGEGNTPLINAVRFSFVDVATELLANKADANQTNLGNWTPLMYAAWNDKPDLVGMLTKHGASLTSVDNDGLTPLAIASQNAKVKAAEALVAAGADVNAPVAKGGYTPLMLAAISGSSELTSSLIAHGAKVNAVNPGGVTALMIAAANDRRNVVALLLKSGADVNARSEDGRTALSIAQSNNNEVLIQLLKEAQPGGAPASG